MSSPVKAIANLKDDENAAEIVKGSGSSSSIKVYPNSKYTPEFKMEAIKFAKETSNQIAAKRFKVDRTSIYKWRKSEDELKML
jgi:transposase-like protein